MRILLAFCVGAAVLCVAYGQATKNVACGSKAGDWDYVAGCAKCTNRAVECKDCPWRTVMTADKKNCLDCPDQCVECELKNNKAYGTVAAGGYYVSNGACKECPVADCWDCNPRQDSDKTSVCYECDAGFTLEEGPKAKYACLKCHASCKTCGIVDVSGTNKTTCTSCQSNQYLNAPNPSEGAVKQCYTCPANCAKCSYINNVAVCTQCNDKFTLDASDPPTCLGCPSRCNKCSWNAILGKTFCESGQCDSEAYKVNAFGDCQNCDINCLTCSSEIACSTCKPENYLVGISCSSCVENCQVCTTGSDCTTCNTGYILNPNPTVDKSCDVCTSFCLACDHTGCLSCQSGYYVSGKTCKKCSSGCATCNSAGCTLCESGYALYNKKCYPCPADGSCASSSCVYDVLLGQAKCTACKSDHIADPSGICHPCPANCDTGAGSCVYNGTAGVLGLNTFCTLCDSAYQEKDLSCTACPPECAACTWNAGINAMDCTTTNCNPVGYVEVASAAVVDNVDGVSIVVGQSYCDKCDSVGCVTCTSAPVCTVCDTTSYTLFTDDACHLCPEYCASGCAVNVTGTMETNCGTCNSGYALNDAKTLCEDCSILITGCTSCNWDALNAEHVCTSCASRYVLDNGKCSACDSHCTKCDINKATKCDANSCDAAYKLNTDDLTCKPCPTFCTDCQFSGTITAGLTPDICTACQSGYALNDQDKCEVCTDNCLECDDITKPSVCDIGWCASGYARTTDGKCKACPKNCRTCVWTGSYTACTDCDGGYYTNDRPCSACPPNCDNCGVQNGINKCSTCKPGYTVNSDGFCKACISNCLTCSGVDTCNVCKPGYGKSGDSKSCRACSDLTDVDNCALCGDQSGEDPATCIACTSSYTLADNALACHDTSNAQNCLTWWDPPPMCDQCQENYNLNMRGLCGTNCSVCGHPDNPLPEEECNAANMNYTVFECIGHSACQMLWYQDKTNKDSLPTVARGCFQNYTCTTEDLNPDLEQDDHGPCDEIPGNEEVKRCTKCCYGDNCNNYQFNGQAAFTSSISLLLAAIAAFFILKPLN